MTPLQRALIFSVLTSLISAAAPAAPGALVPAAPAAFRVPAAVLRLVRGTRRIDIPPQWRRRNWTGNRGQGSCVHAALVNLLHWQGRHDLALWWASHHGNGETAAGLASKLEQAGLQFAETRAGDAAFLEWAIRTRRGAAVVVQNGSHMVNLVGLDAHAAQILDSNDPQRVHEQPREQFLREWKQSGGWAITPLAGPPAAPSPWIVRARQAAEQERAESRE